RCELSRSFLSVNRTFRGPLTTVVRSLADLELAHPGGFRGINQIAIALPVHRLHGVLPATLASARGRDSHVCSFTRRIERAPPFEVAEHDLSSCVCKRLIV